MSHRIITIEREYASGGREIGEMIAERLGIPCYNREILQMASERCNVSMDYLETAEEAAPKSFLYTLMLTSSPTRTIEENLPLSDKVYIIETNIIRELAEKGDCVIVGRCAGIRVTADLLKRRRIMICGACADCLREMETYCWDDKGRRDAPKKEQDHAMDDLRYFAMDLAAEEQNGFAATWVERRA